MRIFLTTVLLALTGMASACGDTRVLNFALNLECLEAEYYSWAAFGQGLSEAQRGGGPPSVGGMKANLTNYGSIAEEIARDEIAHVELLRAALGPDAVPCPMMDLGAPFSAAANAALNTTIDPPFSPYAGDIEFLHGAYLFEDVGVMAYNGAINYLDSAKVGAVARSIMAVEAYHAGIVRRSLYEQADTTVKPYGAKVSAIVDAISGAIDGLLLTDRNSNGSSVTDLVPADSLGLARMASARQVLNVVYLGVNATRGGFFPEGMAFASLPFP